MLLLEENNYIDVAFITLQANFFVLFVLFRHIKQKIKPCDLGVDNFLSLDIFSFLFCHHEDSI